MSGLQKAALPAGVPIQTNIPEVIRLLKANKLDEAGSKAGIVRCCLCYRDSVSPYPALLCGFNQIPEALRLLDQFIQDRNIIITALLRHLSDAALIAG